MSRPLEPAPSPVPRRRLPRAALLRRRACFRQVFDHGRKAVGRRLVVYGLARGEAPSRLGVTVARRFGSAVARNRARRLVREAFRLGRPGWPAGFDWVVLPRQGGFPCRLQPIASELDKLVRRVLAPPRGKAPQKPQARRSGS